MPYGVCTVDRIQVAAIAVQRRQILRELDVRTDTVLLKDEKLTGDLTYGGHQLL